MSGFSNSLSHFYSIHAIRIRYSNSYIQQLRKSLTICLITRSISIKVSDLQYLQFCNNLWWTNCGKSLPNLSTHPSTATALPPPICSERKRRKYVTSKPEPEPETRVWPFPNPKTRVYRRNPGLETLLTIVPGSESSLERKWLTHGTRVR